MTNFATRLRQKREQRGYSRYRLARLAGLSTQAVSNLEAETSAPKLETVRRLATALRCSVSDLIGHAGE